MDCQRPAIRSVRDSVGIVMAPELVDVLVPGVRFEQTSSRLQRDAFTRLAFRAMLARISGIEPLSSEGHSEAQPVDQIRNIRKS